MSRENTDKKGISAMGGFTYTDIFATKGIEYLIVIVFLLILIRLWKFLQGA